MRIGVAVEKGRCRSGWRVPPPAVPEARETPVGRAGQHLDKVIWCSHHYLSGNENGGKTLDIAFKTRKLAAACNTERTLKATYGDPMAKTIMRRLAVLKSARTLSRVPRSKPERMHQLTGDRSGQYAVDLVQPYRLIFVPDHNPLPRLDDGGIDTDRVTAITIMEIADYH